MRTICSRSFSGEHKNSKASLSSFLEGEKERMQLDAGNKVIQTIETLDIPLIPLHTPETKPKQWQIKGELFYLLGLQGLSIATYTHFKSYLAFHVPMIKC